MSFAQFLIFLSCLTLVSCAPPSDSKATPSPLSQEKVQNPEGGHDSQPPEEYPTVPNPTNAVTGTWLGEKLFVNNLLSYRFKIAVGLRYSNFSTLCQVESGPRLEAMVKIRTQIHDGNIYILESNSRDEYHGGLHCRIEIGDASYFHVGEYGFVVMGSSLALKDDATHPAVKFRKIN